MVKKRYAIIILAAGNSSRLGRPKQLIKWNQSTLLNNTILQAQLVQNADVFVTLGGNQNVIKDSIPERIPIFIHADWSNGMGSTIAYSIKQIAHNKYEGIILSVCDQPYISKEIFIKLIEAFNKGKKSIITSQYQSSKGPPTLFSKVYIDELLKLKGDDGAKKIVNQNIASVESISFGQGELDIDTENDLKKLKGI